MASCSGAGDESLEIAAFASPAAAAAFVAAKRELLCRVAAEKGISFPGYRYVDGGTWTIQPDAGETAEQLARTLGVKTGTLRCDGRPPG